MNGLPQASFSNLFVIHICVERIILELLTGTLSDVIKAVHGGCDSGLLGTCTAVYPLHEERLPHIAGLAASNSWKCEFIANAPADKQQHCDCPYEEGNSSAPRLSNRPAPSCCVPGQLILRSSSATVASTVEAASSFQKLLSY